MGGKFVVAEIDGIEVGFGDCVRKGGEIVVADVQQPELLHELDGEGDSADFVAAQVEVSDGDALEDAGWNEAETVARHVQEVQTSTDVVPIQPFPVAWTPRLSQLVPAQNQLRQPKIPESFRQFRDAVARHVKRRQIRQVQDSNRHLRTSNLTHSQLLQRPRKSLGGKRRSLPDHQLRHVLRHHFRARTEGSNHFVVSFEDFFGCAVLWTQLNLHHVEKRFDLHWVGFDLKINFGEFQ
jgi:hypothetical protein